MLLPNKEIGILGINKVSLADGVGVRTVLYIGGCTHKCPGCQNESSWDDLGDMVPIDYVVAELLNNPFVDITISGGDGLTIQYEATLELLKELRSKSSKDIWLYTGYTFEQLLNSEKREALNYIDVLVDGRFIEDKRDITLKFKGSSNQEIVDVKQSLMINKKVLYNI
jgi:anaerobic ribonucleoside-triphosphate reductase activating protein